jgi:hypothetical protein
MKDKIYNWMMNNLYYKIMYSYHWIDSQHKMWLPRWGWSKEQLSKAEKEAKKLSETLNID